MYSDYENKTPIIINDRSSEGLADANIRIGNMLSEMTELQIKLQAMYLVMLDKGIDPQVFEDKIEMRKDGQEILHRSSPRQVLILRQQRILRSNIFEC